LLIDVDLLKKGTSVNPKQKVILRLSVRHLKNRYNIITLRKIWTKFDSLMLNDMPNTVIWSKVSTISRFVGDRHTNRRTDITLITGSMFTTLVSFGTFDALWYTWRLVHRLVHYASCCGSRIPTWRTFVFFKHKWLYLSCGLSYNLYNVKCTKVHQMYQNSLRMMPNVPNTDPILSLPNATGVPNVKTNKRTENDQ